VRVVSNIIDLLTFTSLITIASMVMGAIFNWRMI
jgi:hypothetical protein